MIFRFIVVCVVSLALPGSAMAAPFSFTGPASVSETAGKATYTVSCGDQPNPLSTPILPLDPIPNTGVLTVAVADGPAPAATSADYGALSTTSFTCPPSGASTVDVPITNDVLDELSEKFTVTISGALIPEGAVSQSVTTTITDDDPIASITPLVRVAEGDAGTAAVDLTVTLATAAAQATTIAYSTENASAVAGADYTAASGNLVIPVGATTGTISVPIIGDTTPEKVEAFYLNLSTTDNGSLHATQKQAAVAIFDNDKAPLPTVALTQQAVTVDEGNGGTGNILFEVTLSSPATERTEVKWKTGNWTANKADYDSASGKLVFQVGQRTKTISVDVKGDKRDEPDEAFTIVLESPVAAVLGRKGAFGIITDDDGPQVGIGKPARRGKSLVTKLTCPATATRCRGTLRVTAGKLRIGKVQFDLLKGTSEKVRVRMSRKARRKLGRRALSAKLVATAADASGAKAVSIRKARLKRRR